MFIISFQAEDECQTTPMHEAVIYNHEHIVKLLLHHGASVRK